MTRPTTIAEIDEQFCPWCNDELEDGCCEGCDDRYAANDNFEPVYS